jgi:hypothetical protein
MSLLRLADSHTRELSRHRTISTGRRFAVMTTGLPASEPT